MTPPEAPDHQTGTTPPAVSLRAPSVMIETLKNRPDFLAAARAPRQGTSSLMVQARQRHDGSDSIRIGYTCSKKVGNAVARNRAKRRLREAARAVIPDLGQPGYDYVLIGRAKVTAARPFDLLIGDLTYALRKLHAPK